MATRSDVKRIALSLPGTEQGVDHFAFGIRKKGKLKGYAWVWMERIAPKKPRVPNPRVLAVRVASLAEKERLLDEHREALFTEPHYEGFPAVLVRLDAVRVPLLRALLREGWRCQATWAGRVTRGALMRRMVLSLAISVAIVGLTSAQTLPPLQGAVERVKVHGASLEGNLEGDSPDRDVSIYLPPSYRTNPDRRYPVVYILHGFTDNDQKWFALPSHFVNVPAAMEAALGTGGAREMILVMPNADTRYAGSYYGSSAATGDWETFVTKELVAYIDGHYRTLASRASRGLAGHSMGGYGAIRLAMKFPEVYAGVYAMSACCLDHITPSAEAVQKAEAVKSVDDFNKADFPTKGTLALSAAWSANPKAERFFDLPMKGGVVQPLVAAQWNANSPVAMLGQYAANLKRVRALAIDIGLQDTLLTGNQLLDRLMTDHAIQHSFETYEGTHVSKIKERLETSVLPFFTKHLSFDAIPGEQR